MNDTPINLVTSDREDDKPAPGGDQPGFYRIRLRDTLPAGWSKWFYDFDMANSTDAEGRPVTTLSGYLPDQAALHGLLARIRDTGLQLLSVDLVENPNEVQLKPPFADKA